jgi:FixJ family two-component response regulator
MSVKAMRAGARDFLTKPFREQELLDAVRIALERNREQRDKQQLFDRIQARFDSLTPREQRSSRW